MRDEEHAQNSVEPVPGPIGERYLLVVNIALYRDSTGAAHADPLWFKDLVEHLRYLENLTLACPVVQGVPGDGATCSLDDPRVARLRIVALPAPRSLVRALLALPRTLRRLTRAIRDTDWAHAGVAGWPIPYGWLVTPLAKALGKKLIIVVESAPWRRGAGLAQSPKARITASVYERLARFCLDRADLAVFTQEEYRRSLPTRTPDRGHVIHASWIDEEAIVSDECAAALWDEKLRHSHGALRVLFAGRLEPSKGVEGLLSAMRILDRAQVGITLDILGAGSLVNECRAAGTELKGSARVNVLGTVPYGKPLFELLQGYHALVLPSLTDEQPRIVYDAYSQGVPSLASRTAGLRDCIDEDCTGWLVDPGDVTALGAMLERAAGNVPDLRRMGLAALRRARSMTHRGMHLERRRLFAAVLQAGLRPRSP